MATLSYESAVKMVKTPENLKLVIDSMHNGVDKHLYFIGRELNDWRGMVPALNLKEQVGRNVLELCRENMKQQGPELLLAWKRETLNPTYSELMRACVENGDAGAVRIIAELLNNMPSKHTPPERLPVPVEQPAFSLDVCESLKPVDCCIEDSSEMSDFCEQVEIILQTVLEPEYIAALSEMEPPNQKYIHAVSFEGHVIGKFSNYKTALIKTESGADVRDGASAALKKFQNAKYLLSVGVCYSFEKKIIEGDVIVSKKIIRGKIQLKNGKYVDNNKGLFKISDDLKKKFCKDTSFEFFVSKTNRNCKVYVGHVLSFPAFVDSADCCENLKKALPKAIAGEKEGSTLLKIREELTNKIEVIIIKGVVDFEDKVRANKEDWQFTSSVAAVSYAKEKLKACKIEISANLIDYQPVKADPARKQYSSAHPKTDSSNNVEEPIFDTKKQDIESRKGILAPLLKKGLEDKNAMLLDFTKQIHIILLTVDQCEYQAAATEIRPPNDCFEPPVKFPTNGIVIGLLGLTHVALINVGVGLAAADSLKDAVEKLPNAKFVIAVGGCYGFDRDVLQLGDVLVSNAIISQNSNVEVEETMLKLFTNKTQLFNDFCVSNTGRFSRAYEGKYDLCHANGNRSEAREAIGGEFSMEGEVESYLMHQKEIVGVIVIKGVIGYDENSKMTNWLFTATRAALVFAKQNLSHYDPISAARMYPNPDGPVLSDFDTKALVESGLGYGVDATETNPRSGRLKCVRELVVGAGKNYEQKFDKQKVIDEWDAFNKTVFDSAIKTKITRNPDPVKVFGGEPPSSSVTEYRSAVGHKKITRSIKFNPDLTEMEKNRLINEMCKYLHQEYPRISSPSPSAIENHLAMNKKKLNDFIGCVYKFIEEKKVTHYISALDLGACEYIKSTRQRTGEAPLNINVTHNQGLMARIRGAFARNEVRSKIGENIDTVAIGLGEGVIEYELLPIYSLIQRRHAHFREVVSKAIIFYLEKESGPYLLQCGKGGFLKCENDCLVKVESQEKASQFRIFESNDCKYFSIGHKISDHNDYCYITSESSLSHEVRVAHTGSRSSFSLSHDIRLKKDLCIPVWTTIFCSIQIKQASLNRPYLGWRESDKKLSMKKEKRRETFRLVQVFMHSPENEAKASEDSTPVGADAISVRADVTPVRENATPLTVDVVSH